MGIEWPKTYGGIEVPEDQLLYECAMKVEMQDPGFAVREVIPAGTFLYDPILGWIEEDGTLYMSDHGPQLDPNHWDPDKGHGTIHRLTRDGDHTRLVEPGCVPGMIYLIRRAPEHFGQWGGDIFFPSQGGAGRDGTQSGHLIYRYHEGEEKPVPFAHIPDAGKVGGGTPGAAMIGGFGRKGTPHEGMYLCQTMMNCVIYKVTPDGECAPLLILDEPLVPAPIMPYFVFYAGPVFGDLEGQLLLGGLANSSFEHDDPGHNIIDYFVIEGDTLRPEPVRSLDIGWAMAEVAPPEFGPYGGHSFLVDFGTSNFMHMSKPAPGPLPYDAKILRVDPEGQVHEFATALQGGWNEIRFDRDRMYVSNLRRSYSTGEYHEPDGTLYEFTAIS